MPATIAAPKGRYSVTADPARPYTTGEVAKLCQVAPRTVVKWADSGLLACYVVPGCRGRRFARGVVAAFLAEHGLDRRAEEGGVL